MTEIFDNIRNLYTFKAPCFELKEHIEFFSETTVKAEYDSILESGCIIKLFPSFTPTIWINLGSSYQLKTTKKHHLIDKNKDILLLRDTIVERVIQPNDHIFTIKFHPSAFELIFGLPQSKIGSSIIDLQDIISPFFIEKLKKKDSFEERVELLEELFLSKLKKNQTEKWLFELVNSATSCFMASKMELKNAPIAAQFFISEKSFYRYFKQAIGTNPKNYFSILRARNALMAYQNNKTAFSPYDFGYFDYGHFSKDVVNFTGSMLSTFKP
jgi:AraC-like DNA-binding protein